MINAIRNFLHSIASSTIITLAAQVTELEHRLTTEQEYAEIVHERSLQYLHSFTKAEEQLTLYTDALTATQQALDKQKKELEMERGEYLSLLRVSLDQQKTIEQLTEENQMLKQKLAVSADINNRYLKLNDSMLFGCRMLKGELSIAEDRRDFYRDCYYDALDRIPR